MVKIALNTQSTKKKVIKILKDMKLTLNILQDGFKEMNVKSCQNTNIFMVHTQKMFK